MAKVLVEETNLTNIGNAIRGQNGSTTKYKPGEMADAISAIEPDLQSKTVSSSTSVQTVKPDSGYDGLSQVTVNAMATATQATPSITVSSGGLITASATQTAGYVSAGTKSSTQQLTTKGATTWTPKTTNQTIASGTYLTGTQTIKGDSNLKASNIKSGVSIFGVAGTVEEGVVPTKGFVVNEWSSDGYPTDISIIGMTSIPSYYMYSDGSYVPVISEKLQTLRFPNETTSIGISAFWYCTELVNIQNMINVKTIDMNAFRQCTKLALTELPSVLTKIGNSAFNGCANLALTKLPSGLTSIGTYAFNGCAKLALTELPSGLTSIGQNTFTSCTSLALTEIPSKIASIGTYSFRYCSNITELTCQGIITTINAYAFDGCTKLSKFVLPNITSVPTLSSTNAFTSTPIASGTGYIYVPDSLIDSFKSASNWSTYAAQIKGVSEL